MSSKTAAAEDIIEQVLAAKTSIRTYEIVTDQGKMRVAIPESYRVTFGPISPGTKGGYSSGALCLRVYENATQQRALFTGVTSFRDLSLPVMRAVVRQRGTRRWLADNQSTLNQTLRGIKGSDLERDWINESELEVDAAEEIEEPDPYGFGTAKASYAGSR